MPFQFFERDEGWDIVERRLPHWDQPGTLVFITFRTCDSLPAKVVRVWYAERDRWLRSHGIDPEASDWRMAVDRLDKPIRREFRRRLDSHSHDQLDRCHGACVLRRPDLSKIVADSLLHFDGDRYWLTDFVVMPNHVHVLAAFASEAGMLRQCESWKRFTARKINSTLGQTGRFWQQDAFDHLVRSERQFQYLRDYIANNPKKAKLNPGEYRHYRAEL